MSFNPSKPSSLTHPHLIPCLVDTFVPAPMMAHNKTSTPTSPTSKVSSAELLSMLKKPTTTAGSNVTGSTAAPSMIITDSHSQPQSHHSHHHDASTKLSQPIPLIKDDYTLQGLVNLIKSCPSDRNIFSIGVDLENVGLALNQSEPLRDTLISPWFDGTFEDISAGKGSLMGLERGGDAFAGSGRASPHSSLLSGRRPSTLDSIIPSCYSVPSISLPSTKITSFSDDTLFYIFYSMPGDRMQELAARELYMRNWRFFKPSKSWISCIDSNLSTNPTSTSNNKNNSTNNSIPIAPTANASFFVFDQSTWIKVKRSLSIQIGDLDDSRPTINSSTPSSPNSSTTIMHGSGTLQSTSVTH